MCEDKDLKKTVEVNPRTEGRLERPTLVPAESELEVGLEVRKDCCSLAHNDSADS